jgi:hypothetical protein
MGELVEGDRVELQKLKRRLSRARHTGRIAVVASGLGALLMYIIGAIKVVRAYNTYFAENLLRGTALLEGAPKAVRHPATLVRRTSR